ncbi:hypothetical protein Mapa_007789 [Marchantia paleacea]|nr:hypothetical protein Mapa_007789 [Marchantia paleacea]
MFTPSALARVSLSPSPSFSPLLSSPPLPFPYLPIAPRGDQSQSPETNEARRDGQEKRRALKDLEHKQKRRTGISQVDDTACLSVCLSVWPRTRARLPSFPPSLALRPYSSPTQTFSSSSSSHFESIDSLLPPPPSLLLPPSSLAFPLACAPRKAFLALNVTTQNKAHFPSLAPVPFPFLRGSPRQCDAMMSTRTHAHTQKPVSPLPPRALLIRARASQTQPAHSRHQKETQKIPCCCSTCAIYKRDRTTARPPGPRSRDAAEIQICRQARGLRYPPSSSSSSSVLPPSLAAPQWSSLPRQQPISPSLAHWSLFPSQVSPLPAAAAPPAPALARLGLDSTARPSRRR